MKTPALVMLFCLSVAGACSDDATSSTDDGVLNVDAGGDTMSSDDGGVPDADVSGDADPPDAAMCEPMGTVDCPIVVGQLPYMDSGNTAMATDDNIDVYSCAPDTDESGPEVHYDVPIDTEGRLTVSIVETGGVDVDVHLLSGVDGETCVARDNRSLTHLVTPGTWRVVIDTYHAGDDKAGPYELEMKFHPSGDGSLGTVWNTYYYLADEADHPGQKTETIYDGDCEPLVEVTPGFYHSVCIEGSGIVEDGRVINYDSTCTSSCPAASRCGDNAYRVCFTSLDPETYPFGAGVEGRPLVPDRSIAVDPSFIPIGSSVYLEELDGVVPPGGTEPHDGCMTADDVGGAIDGNHIDFFSGTSTRWRLWEGIFPTRSEFTAWIDHPACR